MKVHQRADSKVERWVEGSVGLKASLMVSRRAAWKDFWRAAMWALEQVEHWVARKATRLVQTRADKTARCLVALWGNRSVAKWVDLWESCWAQQMAADWAVQTADPRDVH